MAEAIAKIKDGSVYDANTTDQDGKLVTVLLEALSGVDLLNVGSKGRTTYSPTNYTAGGSTIDDHLGGIDTALGSVSPSLTYGQVSATSTYSCSSETWEDITGMSITPASGTYLVWYSASLIKTDVETPGYFGLFVDTTLDADSERAFDWDGVELPGSTIGVLTVNGTQAIKVRAKVDDSGTTFSHYERSLMILKVG